MTAPEPRDLMAALRESLGMTAYACLVCLPGEPCPDCRDEAEVWTESPDEGDYQSAYVWALMEADE